MARKTIKLDQHYNRYNAQLGYDTVLYRADRVLQSAELNEVQSITDARITAIADSILLDGDIIQGAQVEIELESATAKCAAGAIYVCGAVRSVPPATLDVPLDGTVSLGVYMHETVVTELEDPDLYNPATGSRAEGEPGAARLKVELSWGLGSNEDNYYAVYTIVNGVITANRQPPMLLRGLGNDGDVLTTRDNALSWEAPGFGWGGGGAGGPDLTGMEFRVPERIIAGESDYVMFDNIASSTGGKILLSIDPLLSGLSFTKTQDIAQGAQTTFTAPHVVADKDVVFRLETMNEAGLISYMLFTVVVVASLDMSKMVAVVPTQILATSSDFVQFSTIADPAGKTVTLALDPLDSGLIFVKTVGIALAEKVTVTAPGLPTGKRVRFAMTASSSSGLSVSRVYELDIVVVVPELSNLVSRVPASISAKMSDYVSFGKATDAQAATTTLVLDPLTSGLVFVKTSGIKLGEQVTVTAPALSAGKTVTFAVRATSSGITVTANFTIEITIAAPIMTAIKATVPATLIATKSGTVSFTGVTDPQGLALTLALDVLSSGLTFSKTTGIALGAAVTVTAPDITVGKKVIFSVKAANSAGRTATVQYEIEITVAAPDISALVAKVPTTIVATQSDYVSFTGATDPQGWPVTLTLEPATTDLVFAKLSNIVLGEQVKVTAIDMLYNKAVTFKVTATNKSGKTVSKSFSLTIIGATLPNVQGFGHTVPSSMMWATAQNVSFFGALGGNSHPVTYRVDKASSGLTFTKTSGIAANEAVKMTSPAMSVPLLATSFKVYAVDSVTGKESLVTLPITFNGAIAKPTIVAPVEAAQKIDRKPVIQLSGFAVTGGSDTVSGMRIQIAIDTAFTKISHDSGWVTSSTVYNVPTQLAYGTQYYLRAQHRGTVLGEGPWSATRSFKVIAWPTVDMWEWGANATTYTFVPAVDGQYQLTAVGGGAGGGNSTSNSKNGGAGGGGSGYVAQKTVRLFAGSTYTVKIGAAAGARQNGNNSIIYDPNSAVIIETVPATPGGDGSSKSGGAGGNGTSGGGGGGGATFGVSVTGGTGGTPGGGAGGSTTGGIGANAVASTGGGGGGGASASGVVSTAGGAGGSGGGYEAYGLVSVAGGAGGSCAGVGTFDSGAGGGGGGGISTSFGYRASGGGGGSRGDKTEGGYGGMGAGKGSTGITAGNGGAGLMGYARIKFIDY